MERAPEQNQKQKKSVPVLPWMRSPIDVTLIDECPLNLLPFLDPRLELALQKMGITSLFPVQVSVWQETIGPGSFERDLCINSPTGSGKTLAYALSIVQMLSTRAVRCLRALVVLPTRDLALQVKYFLPLHLQWAYLSAWQLVNLQLLMKFQNSLRDLSLRRVYDMTLKLLCFICKVQLTFWWQHLEG